MKEYCAFPGVEEQGNKLLVRERGTTLVSIANHKKTGDGVWAWGNESQRQDIARSLVFDAFSIAECSSYPEQCECPDSLWGQKLNIPEDFDYQSLYTSIENKYLNNRKSSEQFKINQLELCDFIFDFISDDKFRAANKAPEKIDWDIDVELPEPV